VVVPAGNTFPAVAGKVARIAQVVDMAPEGRLVVHMGLVRTAANRSSLHSALRRVEETDSFDRR